MTGCRRASPPASAETAEPGMSPSEVVYAVNRARTAGHYDALMRSLVPGDGPEHVSVVLAIDQVLAANASLQSGLTARFGSATAAAFDLADMGESYGVFSLHVRVVRERIDGPRATVTIQEGQNIPLRDVKLERRDGCWLVVTERPEKGLVPRLQKLARTLDQMRGQLERPESTYQDLSDAFRLRVWPQIEEIAAGKD